MLSHADEGVRAAKSGIQGVNSSAWFPIRKDEEGKGGAEEVRDERRIVGGVREVRRRSGTGEYSDQDRRERRSRPKPVYPSELSR